MELAKADACPPVAGQVSGPLLITKGGSIGMLSLKEGFHLEDWGDATIGEVGQVSWERYGNPKGGTDQAGGAEGVQTRTRSADILLGHSLLLQGRSRAHGRLRGHAWTGSA